LSLSKADKRHAYTFSAEFAGGILVQIAKEQEFSAAAGEISILYLRA